MTPQTGATSRLTAPHVASSCALNSQTHITVARVRRLGELGPPVAERSYYFPISRGQGGVSKIFRCSIHERGGGSFMLQLSKTLGSEIQWQKIRPFRTQPSPNHHAPWAIRGYPSGTGSCPSTGLNWPPFRPDTRHSSEGLGISSSTCLCRTTSSELNSSLERRVGDAGRRNRSFGSSRRAASLGNRSPRWHGGMAWRRTFSTDGAV